MGESEMPLRVYEGTLQNWTDTELWKYISMRKDSASFPEANEVISVLQQILPKIQQVLAQGGTPPPDFTLHDAQHSFRVAQRMAEIIPHDVVEQLSTYELALLLLSAYLHDIGMTPPRQKIRSHYQYLATGEHTNLNTEEVKELQNWLDENLSGLEPPLLGTNPSARDLAHLEEILAGYARQQHASWSDEWLWNNIPDTPLGTYADWKTDLSLLCRSHHMGRADLVGQPFDPRLVGSSGMIVHLRYLAAVLRIADVLDFDPERTPPIIFRLRDVTKGSRIYWWKDHAISLIREDNQYVVSARPPNAQIHRAVIETIDQVEAELRLVREMDEATHFGTSHVRASLPHRWDLESRVRRVVQPLNGSYEYIDGTFRPDTARLLELLSGTELYDTPLAAVRELLQNAFDAVRERIARTRLSYQSGVMVT